MKDADGNPILMLNVFAQTLKLHLASWNVHGDKTNETACLEKHLEELFSMFPCLKLLTGDAIYAYLLVLRQNVGSNSNQHKEKPKPLIKRVIYYQRFVMRLSLFYDPLFCLLRKWIMSPSTIMIIPAAIDTSGIT